MGTKNFLGKRESTLHFTKKKKKVHLFIQLRPDPPKLKFQFIKL